MRLSGWCQGICRCYGCILFTASCCQLVHDAVTWINRLVLMELSVRQVGEKTRAEREGRAARAGRVIPLDEFGNPEEGGSMCCTVSP